MAQSDKDIEGSTKAPAGSGNTYQDPIVAGTFSTTFQYNDIQPAASQILMQGVPLTMFSTSLP